MSSLWVAELLISDATRQKIIQRHHISDAEVIEAVVCVQGLEWARDVDEERGERFIVQTVIRGMACLVVLYDAGHPLGDVWRLGSVYPID